jgi:hypothetical protein
LGATNANHLQASGSVVLILAISNIFIFIAKNCFFRLSRGVRGFVNSAAVRLVVDAGSAGLVRVHAHSPFPARFAARRSQGATIMALSPDVPGW